MEKWRLSHSLAWTFGSMSRGALEVLKIMRLFSRERLSPGRPSYFHFRIRLSVETNYFVGLGQGNKELD